MCVGLPGKIIEIKGRRAKIKQKDHFHWVDVSTIEDVKRGDYILTYQEAAVNKISAKEAEEVLKLLSVDSAGDAGVKGPDQALYVLAALTPCERCRNPIHHYVSN